MVINLKKKQILFFICVSILLLGLFVSKSAIGRVVAEVDEKYNEIQTSSSGDVIWEWSPIEILTNEVPGASESPDISVDVSGNVHVVWQDYGYGDIYYKKFEALTQTWTSRLLISTESSANSDLPSIVSDHLGDVHIVWADLTDYLSAGSDWDIFYKKWDNSISSWTVTEVVSTESSSSSYSPSIDTDSSGDIHVTWSDNSDYSSADTDWDIFYKKWISSTTTWTSTEVISTESTGNSLLPDLCVDITDVAHIVWQDQTDYLGSGIDRDVFYKYWNTTSGSWTNTEVVSTSGDNHDLFPALEIDNLLDVHIAWNENEKIYYRNKDSATSLWETVEMIYSGSLGLNQGTPSIGTDSLGNVHLVWTSGTDIVGFGPSAVYYSKRESNNLTWSLVEIVSLEESLGGEDSYTPSLTIDDSGNLHLAWNEWIHGVSDLLPEITYRNCTHSSFTEPILAPLIPNPNPSGIINLDWNSIYGAINYHVYRDSSFIWDIHSLSPIAIVSMSNYTDMIPTNGNYYYAVIAENYQKMSSLSNCEHVEINIPSAPGLSPPELAFVTPNPTDIANVFLDWNDISNSEDYLIYRSSSYIWSVTSLTPIDTVLISEYIDSLPDESFYFYVIVARNGTDTSASNCQYVQYILPHLSEFSVVLALAGSISTLIVIVYMLRRKKG